MGKKQKGSVDTLDAPFDLASRIGMPAALERPEALPETVRRVDGPIEASRATRPVMMIGANEPIPAPIPVRHPDPAPSGSGRPAFIGLEEVLTPTVAAPPAPAPLLRSAPEVLEAAPVAPRVAMEFAPLTATTREAPATGEMDLVVTPLLTPDDWHHFELALRRVPGVGPLRIEYYRAGILKLRVRWSGTDRFAQALAKVPGYRVGILGEDRSTVQIRVARA
jgi:hypothetical protein